MIWTSHGPDLTTQQHEEEDNLISIWIRLCNIRQPTPQQLRNLWWLENELVRRGVTIRKDSRREP